MAAKKHIANLCTAAVLGALCATGAQAGNLEPAGINLGGTSFFDGFGPTEPGLAYLGYYQYSQLNHIEDNNGNDSPAFKNPKINVLLMLNQLAYTTSKTFFNGSAHLGFTGLLPLLHFDTSFDPASPVKLSSSNGFGDLTFGPYLQFNPVMSGGRPVFSQRIEFDVIAPIGKYSTTTDINPSSNFWSLNPYWAGTWLPTPKTEVSARIHYLYNFSNNNPGLPGVSSTKAGQATWVNFTASYAVKPNLNVGLNGYYFKQFTNDTYDYTNGTSDTGLQFGDTGKASLFAIGPGVFWRPNGKDIWEFNLYVQTDATNHTRGNVFNIHWVHPL